MLKPNSLVEFNDIKAFYPGVIKELLLRSYYEFKTTDSDKSAFEKFDKDVVQHPEWIGKVVFITSVDGKLAGFTSFDPRKKPVAEIGHNCIVPEYREKGLGIEQIKYVLSQIRSQGFKKVLVSTCEHKDFIPAQRMYYSCGFLEVNRFNKKDDSLGYKKMIQYELDLESS